MTDLSDASQAIEDRIAALEAAPAPTVDLTALEARVAAVEKALANLDPDSSPVSLACSPGSAHSCECGGWEIPTVPNPAAPVRRWGLRRNSGTSTSALGSTTLNSSTIATRS